MDSPNGYTALTNQQPYERMSSPDPEMIHPHIEDGHYEERKESGSSASTVTATHTTASVTTRTTTTTHQHDSPLNFQPPHEISVTHVNFHQDEEEEDNPAIQLSPRKGTNDSSSKEHSQQLTQHDYSSVSSGPAVMIAFINFHSGGKTGESLAAELVKELGRDYVFDLKGDKGPAKGLRKFKGTPNLRVIIGGGDGTINWVLSTMRMEGMTDVPAGCIPLGTGNDSSRAFGWGFKWEGLSKVRKNIERMRVCTPDAFLPYDRWHAFAQYDTPADAEWVESLPASLRIIQSEADIPAFYRHPHHISLPPSSAANAAANKKDAIHQEDRPRPFRAATIDHDAQDEGYNVEAIPLGERGDHRQLKPLESPRKQPGQERGAGSFFGSEWNNYLSWGVDAQIQNSFHHQRESCRACFCCRPCNMAWMGCFGAMNFCGCQARTLDCSVEVRDEAGQWVNVPLPPGLRSIALLNTPTYAGGRFLWGRDNPRKPKPPKKYECESQRQSLSDGLFEIVGLTSTFHLGMVMIELSRGIRIAQVSEARLTFRQPIFAQADGEPYLDKPGTYHIRPLKPQNMMTRPEKVVKT